MTKRFKMFILNVFAKHSRTTTSACSNKSTINIFMVLVRESSWPWLILKKSTETSDL